MSIESKDKNIAFHNNVDADIWHWWNEYVRNKSELGDRNFTDQQIAELYWENKLEGGKENCFSVSLLDAKKQSN